MDRRQGSIMCGARGMTIPLTADSFLFFLTLSRSRVLNGHVAWTFPQYSFFQFNLDKSPSNLFAPPLDQAGSPTLPYFLGPVPPASSWPRIPASRWKTRLMTPSRLWSAQGHDKRRSSNQEVHTWEASITRSSHREGWHISLITIVVELDPSPILVSY